MLFCDYFYSRECPWNKERVGYRGFGLTNYYLSLLCLIYAIVIKRIGKMKIPVFKVLKYSRRATVLAVLGGLVVVLGGSSAYAAHTNALPGSPLYPLKQLWEEGTLLMSFSPASKAQTHLNIAQDRINAVQTSPAPAPVLAPALQEVNKQLNSALDQSNSVTDQVKRKEIKKDITDAAVEAQHEAERESESPDSSSSSKQEIKNTTEQIKQVQTQASVDD